MSESSRVRVTAVIMAGGRGERLWPRSRAALPKQFVQLRAANWQSDRTLIQATVDRIRPLVFKEDIFVVTGREWAGLAREQLPDIPAENIIVEPAARNTAPCVALATAIIRRRYRGEDPVMIVLPADHVIRDEAAFRMALRAAISAARYRFTPEVSEADASTFSAGSSQAAAGGSGIEMAESGPGPEAEGWADVAATADNARGQADARARAKVGAADDVQNGARTDQLPYPLVTLGIWPTRPETGYGYIKIGRFFRSAYGHFAYEAAEFTEKPDAVKAQHFVASGQYVWNSGMFIWRASAIWEAFRRYLPDVYAAFEGAERVDGVDWVDGMDATDATGAMDGMDGMDGTDGAGGVDGGDDVDDVDDVGGVDPISATKGAVASGSDNAVARAYRQLPSISIDYGVMEKARPIVTILCSFGWDDVGSWSALERLLPADEQGNVIEAAACVAVDSRNCIVGQDRNYGRVQALSGARPRLIALLGVEDLIVVDTDNVLLVASKSRAQDLKKLLERLRSEGLEEYL